jgi:acetylornithine deacetylase/succinyl-diaminopimelate desuccinylase-like protein
MGEEDRLDGLRQAALGIARERRDEDLAALVEELRIPSVSTQVERAADVRRNANWLRARFEKLGFTTSLTDVEGALHPVLQADSPPVAGARTLTIYGHYDVQPPDPLDEWDSPPFEPTVRDGLMYARGASDNKGNHMTAVAAVEHLVEAGGVPLNVRFLIEGEEEVSGVALPIYIKENAARLASDFSLIWDGGFSATDKPALTTGLRGLLYTEIEAQGAPADLHSGIFGGVVPNPLNTLARVIGELKDRDGHVTVPGFYDDVLAPTEDELARLDRPPDLDGLIKGMTGVRELEGEADFDPLLRAGFRPTLDVNGMIGGFTEEGQKTIIPASGRAKVSMRLVPNQDPDKILAAFEPYVKSLGTPGVTLNVRRLSDAVPVRLPGDNEASRAAASAFEAAFGVAPVFTREGGSIPVVATFQEFIGGQVVCSGVIQANSRLHSPNENLNIENYHRGIEMLIHFVVNLAAS